MTFEYFLKKIQDVRIVDFLSFGKLFIANILKPLYKGKYGGCWVICETQNEARDNGYHFFKHVREKYPEILCYYAIKRKSPDFIKVEKYGNIIEYGSLKHWILYLCASHNISSQKGGKPNTAVCAFLELNNMINSKFVFLQHGVIINDCAWARAETTQLDYFVTSTIPEKEYIRNNFGFPPEKIILTGLPRFDNLHDANVEDNYVLIMPTWRGKFALKSEGTSGDDSFVCSAYKMRWEELLNSNGLKRIIDEYKLKVVFFPHRNMQPFLKNFEIINKDIIVADWKKYDIQEEMKKAALMITDYSSVFFDMVYMKKPVIFYQFDYEDFRSHDYKEGYFDYRNNPFGSWCDTCLQVICTLQNNVNLKFQPSQIFLEEHKKIFPYYDQNNSKRIVDILLSQKNLIKG